MLKYRKEPTAATGRLRYVIATYFSLDKALFP